MTIQEGPENVQVKDGYLWVVGFRSSDDEVNEYFKAVPKDHLLGRFKTALKIGTIGVKGFNTTERVDYVEKATNQLFFKASNEFDKILEKMRCEFEEKFGKSGDISQILENILGKDGELFKQNIDPTKEGTPLHEFMKAFREIANQQKEELAGIRKELDKEIGRREEIDNSAKKGLIFEEEFFQYLQRISGDQHDVVEDVTHTHGKGGRMTGDFVVTLNQNGPQEGTPVRRFTIELKDEKLKLPKILEGLNSALECREADYAIHISKYKEQIPDVGWFTEHQGNKLVCAVGSGNAGAHEMHWEILNIAYQWAKIKLGMEIAKEEKADVDVLAIQKRVESVQEKLEDFDTIIDQCAKIERGTKKIENVSKALEKSIRTEMDAIVVSLA